VSISGTGGLIGGTGATLTNSGLIESTHATAVSVTGFSGGSIVNQKGGSIAGLVYGISANSGGTVTNAGQVIGGTAISLGESFSGAGASVVNQAGGSIAGQDFGVSTAGSASVTNAGTISGATAIALGATFDAPGSVLMNQTGGAIVGKTTGVSFAGGGAVTNAGAISGGMDAIDFGAGDATLTLQKGSVLSGAVVASSGFSNSLILQGSGSATNPFVNFSTLQVQGPGVWALGGASSIGATEVQAGALVLTGTLASAFTIDAGATLQGASQNLLATGAIVDDGLLIFDETKSGTFANAITGSGGVGVAGGGTLTLSGATSVATTEVAGGALVVTGTLASAMTIDKGATLQGGAANLAPNGAIVDAGTLVLDQPTDASFAAAIDGPGALVKQNAGALTLTGSSEVATTEVKAGALIVSGQLVSGFTIDPGATLEGSLGAIVPVGVVADNGSLVLDQPINVTLEGSIEGTGALVKNGAGALTLDADSAVATTTVNGGALILGDAAHASATLTSAVTIAAGGALGGHGTIVGSLTNSGAVSPGGSSGVLAINGPYTQSSTGLLGLEIAPSQNSSLRVTGAATLAGTLAVTIDPGAYRKGQQFDLLTAGSISGSFGDVDFVGPGAFSLTTQGSTLVASAAVGNATLSGATANERAILAAFNNYPVGVSDFDPVANAVLGLNPGPAQNLAFDQLGGEVLADLTTAGRDGLRAMMGDVAEQLDTRPQGSVSDPMWLTGYGRFASVGRQSDAQGFSNDTSGVRGGLQRDFGPATTLGVAVGYGTSSLTLDGLPQSGRLDQTTFGAFGEHRWGSVYADLGGFGAYDSGSEHRTILAPGIDRNASGGFSGDAGGIDASLGDRLALGSGWSLAPRAGVTWSRVDQGAFTESGADGADLAVAASHQDATEGLLGARLAHSADFAGGVLDADVSADWAHDFENPTPHAAESFAAAAGTGFGLLGADPGRDAGLVRAGVAYHVSRLSIFASFDGSFSREETQGAVEGGLRVTW
jgi:uncharacterized protein with beta-barrel porin domain